jgi:hypothetical protein
MVRVSGKGHYDGRVYNTKSRRWEANAALLFAPHGRGNLTFFRLSALRRHLARVAAYLPAGGFALVERVPIPARRIRKNPTGHRHLYLPTDQRRVFTLKQLTNFKFKNGTPKR